jgi:ectoine hydroxylase
MTITTSKAAVTAMSAEQREQFERDGYLVVKGALSPTEVEFYAGVLDRYYDEQVTAGQIASGASLHHLGAVSSLPECVGLIDHPNTFPLVWSMLGWNVHIYHSHLDVHPQITTKKPYRFEWHQDGGRQNRELETDPRPRLSVKLAFWLSDVSQPDRGNFTVVPGSHLRNRIDGPPRRDMEWPDPDGAVQVCAAPGDAVFFDRRLWHTRSDNYSEITRKGMFFAYSHRWSYSRDENDALYYTDKFAAFSPIQKQLLAAPLAGPGEIPGDHQWGHYPATTPLYGFLKNNGLLDPDYPPLQP